MHNLKIVNDNGKIEKDYLANAVSVYPFSMTASLADDTVILILASPLVNVTAVTNPYRRSQLASTPMVNLLV